MESVVDQPPRFVSPGNIAETYGISVQTVYEAIWSGKLRARKLGERRWLIEPQDADVWIDQHSTLNTAES